jgi:hypothetical protein
MRAVLQGRTLHFHLSDEYSSQDITIKVEVVVFDYLIQLIVVEDGWRGVIRELIATSSGVRNQGAITEKGFAKAQKDPIEYKGLKFASHSEIRIAQEFEQRKVLFFPLAVGVRADTGNLYKDHREVDFLVCHNGAWGILEVSGPTHDGRFAKDAEKDAWFKQSGILCIEHRTAEQCFSNPKQIVDGFLRILAQHKR